MDHLGVHQAPLGQTGPGKQLSQLRLDREDHGEHSPSEGPREQVLPTSLCLLSGSVPFISPGSGLHPHWVSPSAHLLLHPENPFNTIRGCLPHGAMCYTAAGTGPHTRQCQYVTLTLLNPDVIITEIQTLPHTHQNNGEEDTNPQPVLHCPQVRSGGDDKIMEENKLLNLKYVFSCNLLYKLNVTILYKKYYFYFVERSTTYTTLNKKKH